MQVKYKVVWKNGAFLLAFKLLYVQTNTDTQARLYQTRLIYIVLMIIIAWQFSEICFRQIQAKADASDHSLLAVLSVPRADTSLGLRCFAVAGPRVWNLLPHELRQCNILSSFKWKLETYYFRRHMDS